jgi:2-dehydro-3-deoxy-D-arabinonate dehydratase
MALWRIAFEGQIRWAGGNVDAGPEWLLPWGTSLDALLAGGAAAVTAALEGPDDGAVPTEPRVLAPVERQEVWAAGITYERARSARRTESGAPGLYEQVYEADRPELFFKSTASRVRGPDETVGIRADSRWDVAEPEVGLVATADGALVGYVIGNDMTSRSIADENPLYLAQAKIYDGGCALGPCIVPVAEAPALDDLLVDLVIRRAGQAVVEDRVSAGHIRRPPQELLDWLYRALAFPLGVVLLIGTGIVPEPAFTLEEGDEVSISVSGLGTLTNPVVRVGRGAP